MNPKKVRTLKMANDLKQHILKDEKFKARLMALDIAIELQDK